MGYVAGIDLGTTYTAAAVHDDDGTRMISLSHDRVAIPSVVAPLDGRSLIGDETAAISATAPWNVAREFKRRFGDSTPMYIDGKPCPPEDLMGDLLEWVVRRVSEHEGSAPDRVVVTHPATWGLYKLDLLRSAAASRSIDSIDPLAEPVAAAIHYQERNNVEDGSTIAVYDFGGGTFDVTLLERSADGFAFKGAGGVERAGGLDLDAAVFRLVVDALADDFEHLDEEDPATQRAVSRLREECTRAKIGLSYDTRAIVPVVLPGLVSEVLVQRKEFEDLVEPLISETVEATMELIERAGQDTQLDSVLLVGGSSRVPIVSQLLTRSLGVSVAVDTHPKQAVALGAAASANPARRAGLTAPRSSFFAKSVPAEMQELPESTVTIPSDVATSVELRQRFVVVLTGPRGGLVVDLPPEATVVGRQDGQGVIGLDSPLVSRQHLEFVRDGTKISVRDLGSTNGTTIDGSPLGPALVSIEPGTIVNAAGTLLMIDGPGAQVESPNAVAESWSMPPLANAGLRRRRSQADQWMQQLDTWAPALQSLAVRSRRARRFQRPGAAVLRLWREHLPRRLADISVPPGSVVLGWSSLPSLLDIELPGALSGGDRERAQEAIGDCAVDASVPLVVSLLGRTTMVGQRGPEAAALARSIVAELELTSPLLAISVTSDDRGDISEIQIDMPPSAQPPGGATQGRVVFGLDSGSAPPATAVIELTGDLAEYRSADIQATFIPVALAS